MVTLKPSRDDAVFRAIADPTRREILRLLRTDRLTVGEIAANFRTSRPAISKHLRLLRAAGLVSSHKDGTANICGLNPKPLKTVNNWLQDYRVLWGESLRNLKRYIERNRKAGREEPMNPTTANEIITEEITIKGSAERIFEALANPEQRLKWWGSKGAYESTEMDSDLRVGGKWMMKGVAMKNPFSCHGEYTRIDRPRLLEFTWNPSWQGDDAESLVRFDLNERDGVTTVRVTHSGLTPAARDVHKGWPQVLGWLKAYVE